MLLHKKSYNKCDLILIIFSIFFLYNVYTTLYFGLYISFFIIIILL